MISPGSAEGPSRGALSADPGRRPACVSASSRSRTPGNSWWASRNSVYTASAVMAVSKPLSPILAPRAPRRHDHLGHGATPNSHSSTGRRREQSGCEPPAVDLMVRRGEDAASDSRGEHRLERAALTTGDELGLETERLLEVVQLLQHRPVAAV